jgi:putative redox protein
MVQITATYQGNLRCTSRHGPSGTELSTDAPKDNQGLGESFSPTDLVATALCSCAMTIIGIVAHRDGIDVNGMSGRVVKGMAANPRRIISSPVEITLPATLTESQRATLECAARTCPVSQSLHPDIEQTFTFVYPA